VKFKVIALILLHQTQAMALGNDKLAHVAVSAGLTTALYLTMSAFTGRENKTKKAALLSAIAMGLAVGLAKESVDSMVRGDRHIDSGDMAANALGVGLAAAGIVLLDF